MRLWAKQSFIPIQRKRYTWAGTLGTAVLLGGGSGAATNWFGMGGNKKETRPSYEDLYKRIIDPKVKEYQNTLEGRANKYLSSGYEAYTPDQQNLIYGRIKSQLQPTFDEGIQSQLQNIQGMGIEGTPGAAILSKLRKDYANDLSGRATDIAIKNMDLTRSDIGKGEDILGQLRSSLMGEASGIANADYGGAMSDYNYNRQYEDTANSDLWSSVGNLGGNLAMSYLSPETSFMKDYLDILKNGGTGTSKGMLDILGNSDVFGGKRKSSSSNRYDYLSQLGLS